MNEKVNSREPSPSSAECPKCGLINPRHTPRCDCGYNFVSGKIEIDSAGAQSGTPKRLTGSSMCLIAFGLAWCFLLSLTWPLSLASDGIPETLGRLTGALTWPLLLAYCFRGRKRTRDWNSFARWFFWLCLLIPTLFWNMRQARLKAEHTQPKVSAESQEPNRGIAPQSAQDHASHVP